MEKLREEKAQAELERLRAEMAEKRANKQKHQNIIPNIKQHHLHQIIEKTFKNKNRTFTT